MQESNKDTEEKTITVISLNQDVTSRLFWHKSTWILEDYKIDTLTEKAKNIVTSLNSS